MRLTVKIFLSGVCAFALSSALAAAPAGSANTAAPSGATAASAFVKLPAGVLDILPSWTRQDMLTYFEADSIWQAPNSMGGVSSLVAVTDDFLEVRISDVSTMQIKKLPFKKDCIFMTVYTVGAEGAAPDSQVNFYTPSMENLPSEKFLPMPRLRDYLDIPKDSPVGLKELEQLVAFPTYRYSAAAAADTLSSVLTVGDYMTREDFEKLKPYVREGGVNYVWNGSKFK